MAGIAFTKAKRVCRGWIGLSDSPGENPTFTIMALIWRATDSLAELIHSGEA